MAMHHIIPKFILKGFVINPNAEPNNQEIMIYDRKTQTTKNVKIANAYAIKDFNSPETEKYLCDEYENKVALIFRRIKKRAGDNEKDVVLSNEEYKLLFRFFIIMWRRNDIQLEKVKEMFKNFMPEFKQTLEVLSGKNSKEMRNEEYKNLSHEELFELKEDIVRIKLYDMIIQQTTYNDETVMKTLINYYPCIVKNNSKINFLLHNTYATNLYIKREDESDFPGLMLCPISNKLCFCLMYSNKKIDVNQMSYKIPIDGYEDEVIKEMFIKRYITKTATSFVADKTSFNLLKEELNE